MQAYVLIITTIALSMWLAACEQQHDGNYPGFTSTMGYFPELQVAGAFQINTCDPRSLQLPMHRLLVECADIVKEELSR